MKRKKYLFLLVLSLFVALPASASLVPSCALAPSGPTCSVCDVVSAGIGVANLLASFLSGIVLLMFVIGGFCMIISRGNEELVNKGRKILTGAVIGIVIVTFAWIMVNTVLRVLVKGSLTKSGDVAILSGTWWSPTCSNAKVSTCTDATVGTACKPCTDNGVTGTENCYCHKKSATDDALDKNCGSSSCTCISLCEVWKRTYSIYASYQCFSSVKSGSAAAASDSHDCTEADICPRTATSGILGKCCK